MYLSLLDLMRRQTGLPPAPAPAPQLRPEWIDDGQQLLLRLPLSGIDPKSVQVQIRESSLTVAGSHDHEERLEAPGFYREVLATGVFAKTFGLPSRVLPRHSRVSWQGPELLEIRLTKA